MMRKLLTLLFLYFMASASAANANPKIFQAAEKFILLCNVLALKIMPPGSQNYEVYKSISFNSGLNIMIDDVRILLSELQHRSTRKDLSVKSLFVMNMPKLPFPVLPPAFYEATADLNLQQTRAVSLDQFCLQNFEEPESQLYEKLNNLLSRIKEIIVGNQLFKSLCENLSLHTLLSEVVESLHRIRQ